jgi:hypothetical protein
MPMRAMSCLRLLALVSLVGASPAHAEPFSVKCDQTVPVFVTFDEANGHAVWEVPNGGIYAGSIDYADDDEIRFHLSVAPQYTARSWNRKIELLMYLGPNSLGIPVPCPRSELRPIIFGYDTLSHFEPR